jgi:hypothetical protein
MPFILRPMKPPGTDMDAYAYVAQAYVHGIMDGGILKELRNAEWIYLH